MTSIALSCAPQRVLIIKPSSIGDIVHALPVLPRLRTLWPQAKLSWLVTPWCADLLRGHPLIDEVILFERKRLGHMWYNPAALGDLLGFVRSLRRRKFDLVIDLQGLLRSAGLAWISGAPWRVGLANAREGAPLFYTHRVDCSLQHEHAVERYLKVATALGCGAAAVEFRFAVDDADRQYVRELLPGAGRYAVLLPGSNWSTKRWPPQRFAQLVEPLRDRFGLESVVAGSPDDAKLAGSVGAKFDVTGKTNLRQMVALLEAAQLVVANDAGPMHIAAALGRPLVALYGPTSPTRTGPFARMESVLALDLPCRPCFSRSCSHQSCLQWLPVEPALRLAEEQMTRFSSLAQTDGNIANTREH